MNSGIRRSLMLGIFEYGAVLLMCMFRKIKGRNWDHIWRSVSLLDILMATKDGGFIILLQRGLLFVKGQILTSIIIGITTLSHHLLLHLYLLTTIMIPQTMIMALMFHYTLQTTT